MERTLQGLFNDTRYNILGEEINSNEVRVWYDTDKMERHFIKDLEEGSIRLVEDMVGENQPYFEIEGVSFPIYSTTVADTRKTFKELVTNQNIQELAYSIDYEKLQNIKDVTDLTFKIYLDKFTYEHDMVVKYRYKKEYAGATIIKDGLTTTTMEKTTKYAIGYNLKDSIEKGQTEVVTEEDRYYLEELNKLIERLPRVEVLFNQMEKDKDGRIEQHRVFIKVDEGGEENVIGIEATEKSVSLSYNGNFTKRYLIEIRRTESYKKVIQEVSDFIDIYTKEKLS